MSERPNFYPLLGLDPALDDWAAIEPRLREKQRAWSRDKIQGNPRARREADRNLALVPDIEAVLSCPESRRAEAREARRLQELARREQTRDLDEAISLLRSRPPCSEDQLEQLVERFAGTLEAEAIKKRLAAAGVPLAGERPAHGPRLVRERIPSVTAQNVRRNLDHLGHATLYDFLGLKPRSSPRALCDRADEIYQRNLGSGRIDPDASAANELAGIAKSLFHSEQTKATYDESLAVEAMERLKPHLELAAAGGFLGRAQLDALVRIARQHGVAAEEAQVFIADYAAGRKWGMQHAETELPSAALQLCGWCSQLAPAEAGRCSGCGRELAEPCPRCGAAIATAHAACTSCGCRTGDAPLVRGLLEKGKRLSLAGADAEALRCFDRALSYWPGWQPAVEARGRIPAEVADLELVAGDGETILRWTTPPGAHRVEVWRRRGGPPGAAGEGLAVTVTGNGAHDTGLVNGESYGYLVSAVFENPVGPGGERRTAGRTASATPVAPPAPVEDLAAVRSGRHVQLRWTASAGATVEIRQAPRLPDYAPGLILPAAQADRFGAVVLGAGRNQAQATLTGQGRTFFVPLSLAAGTAVAGRAVEVTTLDPVSALSARRAGAGIALSWEWPPGCEEVVVAWSHDASPREPENGAGHRVRVTRREYERAGCWLLAEAEAKRHYFAVFATAPCAKNPSSPESPDSPGGDDLHAAGVEVVESMGHEATVSYRVVVRKGWPRRAVAAAHVELRCDERDRALPALLAVGKPSGVPVSPRDGELLTAVPSLAFRGGRATLPLPKRHWRSRSYVRLFFRDAAVAREVRLLPAEKERLRLA